MAVRYSIAVRERRGHDDVRAGAGLAQPSGIGDYPSL